MYPDPRYQRRAVRQGIWGLDTEFTVPEPQRPTLREAHPVRPVMVATGAGMGALWFGLLATAAWSRVVLTILIGIGALLAAVAGWVLVTRGDRGLGAGLGLITGIAVTTVVAVWFNASVLE